MPIQDREVLVDQRIEDDELIAFSEAKGLYLPHFYLDLQQNQRFHHTRMSTLQLFAESYSFHTGVSILHS